ncbi:MAG: hypothetical protein ACTHOE_07320 [Conexibacter sp.]
MSATGDGSTAEGDADSGVGEDAWTPAERAVLDAALDFYGAAEGVIDLAGGARPQLRHDAAAFKAIQRAMAALEARVVAAHAAGTTAERIAQIARMEQETIDLILRRRSAAPSSGGS